jgi:hypothetical protein
MNTKNWNNQTSITNTRGRVGFNCLMAVRSIVIPVHDRPAFHEASLRRGADAFIPKNVCPTSLPPAHQAVRRCHIRRLPT